MALKTCVFIDGENFRQTIVNLFAKFNPSDYLPKKADWSGFVDWLVTKTTDGLDDPIRVRTYWYVIEHIDFRPYSLPKVNENREGLKKILSFDDGFKAKLNGLSGPSLDKELSRLSGIVQERERAMRKRFEGWTRIQNAISAKHKSFEFRKAGSILYDLYTKGMGKEKAVDVKLATDLLELRNIYDLAIIVSGDQDYVPAAEVIKNSGKHVTNVAFKTRGGKLLPGGSWRLNASCDWVCEIEPGRNFV